MRKTTTMHAVEQSTALSNKWDDSQLALLTTTADGTDGKTTLPSASPSGLNRKHQNNLRSADDTDGIFLLQQRSTPRVTAKKVAVTRAVTH